MLTELGIPPDASPEFPLTTAPLLVAGMVDVVVDCLTVVGAVPVVVLDEAAALDLELDPPEVMLN